MKVRIRKAKAIWQLANNALGKARGYHLQKPTMKNWRNLVAATNRWEIAAAAWSAAIKADGDWKVERAEFVAATTIGLPTARKFILQ